MIELADATKQTISLFARGGDLGIVTLDDRGEPNVTPFRRVRTHRNKDKSGQYRWYNDYELPEERTPLAA